MKDYEGSIKISVVVLEENAYAILLEVEDEDHAMLLPPAMAKEVAKNLFGAVDAARKMGWKEEEDEIYVCSRVDSNNTSLN